MNNRPVGNPASLRYGFLGEFNSLEFAIPTDVRNLLRGANGNFSNCKFQIALSVGNPNNARFLLDNMGFIQP